MHQPTELTYLVLLFKLTFHAPLHLLGLDDYPKISKAQLYKDLKA